MTPWGGTIIMSDSRPVDLDIAIKPRLELGAYANAFRVLDGDIPARVFLEFLLYSPTVNRALVVARIRVSRKLLPVMISQLSSILELVDLSTGIRH